MTVRCIDGVEYMLQEQYRDDWGPRGTCYVSAMMMSPGPYSPYDGGAHHTPRLGSYLWVLYRRLRAETSEPVLESASSLSKSAQQRCTEAIRGYETRILNSGRQPA